MYERIVVGSDGSDRSSEAVEHAAQLARLCGAKLHLVQGCGSPIIVSSLHGEVAGFDPKLVVDASVDALTPYCDQLRASGLEVELHVLPEGGADALLDVAARVDADLIVVGSRGMTGVRRVLGSIPNTVAHHAPCAVLIVQTG